jgi:hypothetical protein
VLLSHGPPTGFLAFQDTATKSAFSRGSDETISPVLLILTSHLREGNWKPKK